MAHIQKFTPASSGLSTSVKQRAPEEAKKARPGPARSPKRHRALPTTLSRSGHVLLEDNDTTEVESCDLVLKPSIVKKQDGVHIVEFRACEEFELSCGCGLVGCCIWLVLINFSYLMTTRLWRCGQI